MFFPRQKRWVAAHKKTRDTLGLPPIAQPRAKTLAHSPRARCLSLRMLDLLGLHWEVACRNGVQPQEHMFVWDLSNSVCYPCRKDPKFAGVMPCVLREHVYWVTKLGRSLTGAELMRVHGFDAIKEGFDDKILKQLAGDTISVAPIGCILALCLANTKPGVFAAAGWKDHGDHWIGDSFRKGIDRRLDNLTKLSDKKKKQKIAKRCNMFIVSYMFICNNVTQFDIRIWARRWWAKSCSCFLYLVRSDAVWIDCVPATLCVAQHYT